MKSRMINMLIVLLAMCFSTASKESSEITNKCKTCECVQKTPMAATAENNKQEEVLLSPINLFMIHAQ